jgi:hypothetical protein
MAHGARTRNLSATASLLRAANGLLKLLARIEKAEEVKAQHATAALQDECALEEEFNQHLDRLAERMRQSQAVQQLPPDVPDAASRPARTGLDGALIEVSVLVEHPMPDGPDDRTSGGL